MRVTPKMTNVSRAMLSNACVTRLKATSGVVDSPPSLKHHLPYVRSVGRSPHGPRSVPRQAPDRHRAMRPVAASEGCHSHIGALEPYTFRGMKRTALWVHNDDTSSAGIPTFRRLSVGPSTNHLA